MPNYIYNTLTLISETPEDLDNTDKETHEIPDVIYYNHQYYAIIYVGCVNVARVG
jgi:hypothetical protein